MVGGSGFNIGEKAMLEDAKAALQYGFDALRLEEIVSFTNLKNMRSRHVMQKIGMHQNEVDDFYHPKIQEGHPLKRHILYRVKSSEWQQLKDVL